MVIVIGYLEDLVLSVAPTIIAPTTAAWAKTLNFMMYLEVLMGPLFLYAYTPYATVARVPAIPAVNERSKMLNFYS